MRIALIRHFPVKDAAGLCYGQLDLPLAHATRVADIQPLRMALPGAVRVYSSPLSRCWQLAQLLDLAAQADDRLQELDFGRWEGRRWDEIGAMALDEWIASGYAATHGGEGLTDLQERVWQWADELAAAGQPEAIAITHAGVIRALWSRTRAWDACLAQPVPYGEIQWLDWPGTGQPGGPTTDYP
ncbi:alpha-ribazole phosphatase [Silvimonas terrae]|uniref:Alpha-ribazole phosphatase n=1 Tax=Silvimonas terrae TaxID=300266 RepID=A0A840RMZ4_9NEIS|nr:alpha-ribazole phosphatase [Silvimonas terrae]